MRDGDALRRLVILLTRYLTYDAIETNLRDGH